MSVKSKGQKKRNAIAWIVSIVIVAALLVGLYLFFDKIVTEQYMKQINNLTDIITTNTHSVYVAANEIKAGDIVTADKLYSDNQMIQTTADLFSASDLDKIALVDIPAGTVMYAKDVAAMEEGLTERLTEYSCFFIPQNIKEGAYIDIRIRYQNGEDFVVLSKKRVEFISESGLTCFLKVDEREIQLMSSAIIDMKRWNATIYADSYTAPTVQEPSLVTYIPNTESLDILFARGIIETEEDYINNTNYRNALDERLKALLEESGDGSAMIRDTTSYEGGEILDANGDGADEVHGENFDFHDGTQNQ